MFSGTPWFSLKSIYWIKTFWPRPWLCAGAKQIRVGVAEKEEEGPISHPHPTPPHEAMHPGTTHHNLPQLSGCSQLFCITSYPATTSHGVSKQAHGLCVEPAASGPTPPSPQPSHQALPLGRVLSVHQPLWAGLGDSQALPRASLEGLRAQSSSPVSLIR